MTKLEILKEIVDADASESVYINSLKIIPLVSEYHSKITDIYKSKFGTLIVDWKIDSDNEFSLEIGSKDCGYFAYTKGNLTHISETGGQKTLVKDLEEWITCYPIKANYN